MRARRFVGTLVAVTCALISQRASADANIVGVGNLSETVIQAGTSRVCPVSAQMSFIQNGANFLMTETYVPQPPSSPSTNCVVRVSGSEATNIHPGIHQCIPVLGPADATSSSVKKSGNTYTVKSSGPICGGGTYSDVAIFTVGTSISYFHFVTTPSTTVIRQGTLTRTI